MKKVLSKVCLSVLALVVSAGLVRADLRDDINAAKTQFATYASMASNYTSQLSDANSAMDGVVADYGTYNVVNYCTQQEYNDFWSYVGTGGTPGKFDTASGSAGVDLARLCKDIYDGIAACGDCESYLDGDDSYESDAYAKYNNVILPLLNACYADSLGCVIDIGAAQWYAAAARAIVDKYKYPAP